MPLIFVRRASVSRLEQHYIKTDYISFVLTSIVLLVNFFPYRRYLFDEYNKVHSQQDTKISHKPHHTRTEFQ